MFKLGWTTYLIIGLGACIIALGLLYRHSLTELGETKEKLSTASQKLTQAEEDKRALESSLELNASKSRQDEEERQRIDNQVRELNASIAKLTSSNNILKKKANANESCSVYDDDPKLSDDLRLQLNNAYKGSDTDKSTK